MERVIADGDWTLFCPRDCPELSELKGEEFRAHYVSLEDAECTVRRKTLKARELWKEILSSQVETGTPYIMFKDSCNAKSNQKNLGTIKSSNLCCEIVEYSDSSETAVCNLASVALPAHLRDGVFDYDMLMKTVKQLVRNLNRVIDRNYYPTPECRHSNLRHRPIAIGVQGFADVLAMLDLPFDDPKAEVVNEQIFAHIYYAALEASCELSRVNGPYESFHGSPASRGVLQFDMWGVEPAKSPLMDWDQLRRNIGSFGLRNSLLTAVMPTASTAQILGNTEAVDPVQSNVGSSARFLFQTAADVFAAALQQAHACRELLAAQRAPGREAGRALGRGHGALPLGAPRLDRGPPEHRRAHEERLQDGVGDQAEDAGGPGRGPRAVHRPGPEPVALLRRGHGQEAERGAVLRVEARSEDRHVLLPHAAQVQRHGVHGRV